MPVTLYGADALLVSMTTHKFLDVHIMPYVFKCISFVCRVCLCVCVSVQRNMPVGLSG